MVRKERKMSPHSAFCILFAIGKRVPARPTRSPPRPYQAIPRRKRAAVKRLLPKPCTKREVAPRLFVPTSSLVSQAACAWTLPLVKHSFALAYYLVRSQIGLDCEGVAHHVPSLTHFSHSPRIPRYASVTATSALSHLCSCFAEKGGATKATE